MPTGYTAGVQDGTVTDFKEFALTCARAFGACVMLRDSPFGPAPKTIEHDECCDKWLATATDDYESWKNKTDTEKRQQWEEHCRSREAKINKIVVENEIKKKRYENMLAKVDKWEPPTGEHEGMKKFMREQLTESMRFDCYRPDMFVAPPFEEWVVSHESDLVDCIERYAKDARLARERTDARNKWLAELHASLNGEQK